MIDKENAICMIIELYAAMAQAEIEKKEKHRKRSIVSTFKISIHLS